jgi:hypothetical protein
VAPRARASVENFNYISKIQMKFSTLALALGATEARVHLFDKCPTVQLASNFDKTKFAG